MLVSYFMKHMKYLLLSVFFADMAVTGNTVPFTSVVRMFITHLRFEGIFQLPSITCHVVILDIQYINVHLFTRSTEVTFTVMTVILRGPRTEAAVFNAGLVTDLSDFGLVSDILVSFVKSRNVLLVSALCFFLYCFQR